MGHIYQNPIFYNFVYAFHMPLFFIAAGWLYKTKSVKAYTIHRFFTVMIPYFSFGLLTLLYWQLIERHFRVSDMTFLQSLIGLIRGEYDFLDFNVHLWFLPCFYMTVVIYNGLRNTVGRSVTYIIAVVLSTVYVFSVYWVALPSLPWGLNRVCQYIGFYAIGNWMSEMRVNEKVELKPVWAVIATALLAVVLILSLLNLTSGIFWFITGTIGTVAVGIYSILLSGTFNFKNLISFLGRISLVVLCVHGPVYRVVSKILSVVIGVVMHVEMDTDTVRSNFFFALIIVAITLVICELAYMVINRVLPWMIGESKRSRKAILM
ncbi:MAG: acyltransferase family protein [Lachnospiraceae bacterium]|nr:acyltransferase family protein [Lachnospiraceae bacterium]